MFLILEISSIESKILINIFDHKSTQIKPESKPEVKFEWIKIHIK